MVVPYGWAKFLSIVLQCRKDMKFQFVSYTKRSLSCYDDINHIASRLQKCAKVKALIEGKCIHEKICKSGLEKDRYLGNLLVHMYGRCGALIDARNVFDNMDQRNIFSWNIMIASYIQNDELKEALDLFNQMPQRDITSWNAIIAAYMQQGNIREALELFNQMPKQNAVSWNTMIAGYVQHGKINKAVYLFEQMPERNIVAWNAILTGYSQHGDFQGALSIFEEMPQKDIISWTAMISSYARHGKVTEALQLFKQMPERDTVSWNVMIATYVQQGRLEEAFELFQQMPERDAVSWTTIISAYAQEGQLDTALYFFRKMPQPDLYAWNAIIAGYAQHGYLEEAIGLFNEMPRRDLVSWNSILSGHVHWGRVDDALQLFWQMQVKGFKPDKITFITILDGCSIQAHLPGGRDVHGLIACSELELDVAVGNALVSMYGKCGSLADARAVFREMQVRDIVTWSGIIAAYAQHGHGNEALHSFLEMRLEGLMPNDITFISILSACGHAGLVDEGFHWIVSMGRDHGVIPILEHYNCTIDLFGRSGWLDEAEALVQNMPFLPDAACWRLLLRSCTIHVDVVRGKRLAGYAFKADPEDGASYVLLSNLLAAAGWLSDAIVVRRGYERVREQCRLLRKDCTSHAVFRNLGSNES